MTASTAPVMCRPASLADSSRGAVEVFEPAKNAASGFENAAARSFAGRQVAVQVGDHVARQDGVGADVVAREFEAPSPSSPASARPSPTQIQGTARRKLEMIDAAPSIESLRVPPGNRLEALKGDRKGQWSVRINDQWRVCFRCNDGTAHDAQIVDYH